MSYPGHVAAPHLRPIAERIWSAAVVAPPAPWRLVSTAAVGGLTSCGFADGTDLLLVISSDGRGVFDALAGTRVARERTPASPGEDDEIRLRGRGIGPLAGATVRLAGLYGGGLPATTDDGWSIERCSLAWPDEIVLLLPPGSALFESRPGRSGAFVKLFDGRGSTQLRAVGFSETGRTLAIATASDVTLLARPGPSR